MYHRCDDLTHVTFKSTSKTVRLIIPSSLKKSLLAKTLSLGIPKYWAIGSMSWRNPPETRETAIPCDWSRATRVLERDSESWSHRIATVHYLVHTTIVALISYSKSSNGVLLQWAWDLQNPYVLRAGGAGAVGPAMAGPIISWTTSCRW